MTTPNGSAVDSGKVEKVTSSRLQQKLGVGTDAVVREVIDYSRLMEIEMKTVPEGVEVRWVGINNAQQIERHLANGYTYVLREDGITTISGLDKTDAAGEHVIVGDCVLMACARESYVARHREIRRRAEQRLDSTVRGDEVKGMLQAKNLKIHSEDERRVDMK